MRYLLYQYSTRSSIYFRNRSDLNKWIKSHFRLMSYRTMCTFDVCRYHEDANIRDRISSLPTYILSHLKTR